MNLYKRTLKDVESFQKLSEEEKERNIYLYKNRYLTSVIIDIFTVNFSRNSNIVLAIDILCGILLLISYFSKCYYYSIMPIIILPFLVAFMITAIYFRINLKKKNREKFIVKLFDKISIMYLWNHKVITLKNWKQIKKDDKTYYKYVRSSKCNNKCYNTAENIARIVIDPDLKLLWINAVDSSNGHRFGHAILKRGDYIYDSNQRRTYDFEKYMKCYQAKVFREFTFKEYMDDDYMYEAFRGEFKTYCKERGIVRCTED